ncbi:uncharacterized protein PRCAT00004608001 [Priceomyces carsonii]|uniref:uncharacterized protein n=1 Tax=Priceomyces carsonii TaxID=28549 RepID=UPI002EDB05E3|nr:unnamed protein product [Priceomyces carsonii]
MPRVNLNQLRDKALDVDPDVRFMALEDFRKYVNDSTNSVSSKSIKGFIPVLFRLLNDQNSDVQSQAVKSFDPAIGFLSNDSIVDLLDQLLKMNFTNSSDNNDFKSFARSIPSMAIHSIFQSKFKFSNSLARLIINRFMPQMFQNKITIDTIEILIDLLVSVGKVLDIEEISSLAHKLITISFSYPGIVSKRAGTAYNELLNYFDDTQRSEGLDELISIIDKEYEANMSQMNAVNVKLQLYSLTLDRVSTLDRFNETSTLSSTSIKTIYDDLVRYLNLKEVENDVLDSEDLDYDKLVQDNSLREDVLRTLNDFINALPYNSVLSYIENIIDIIIILIRYDPLKFEDNEPQDDQLEFSDSESEIAFSDEENNEGDENDISWKIRFQTNIIATSLNENFPLNLPLIYSKLSAPIIDSIGDRNFLVSNESVKALISIIDMTSIKSSKSYYAACSSERRSSDISMSGSGDPLNHLVCDVFPVLEKGLFERWLIGKNVERFSVFLSLVESMMNTAHENLSSTFLSSLFDKFKEYDVNTNGSMDYLCLYKVILLNYDIATVPKNVIQYIIEDLCTLISSQSSFYNILSESINISVILFGSLGHSQDVGGFEGSLESLFHLILRKINDRQYSSDLRQQSLVGLKDFVINIKLVSNLDIEEIISIFKESLSYEVTLKYALESLVEILESPKNKQFFLKSTDFSNFLVQRFKTFLSSTDETIYFNSLRLLNLISDQGPLEDPKGVCDCLVEFLYANGSSLQFQQLSLAFDAIRKNVSSMIVEKDFLTTLIQKVINTKLTEIDDYNLNSIDLFIEKLCQIDLPVKLFDVFLQNLNLELFISAKILALITVQKRLYGEVDKRELELIQYIDGEKTSTMNLLFNIQYLGNVGSKIQLKKIGFQHFLKFINDKDESIKRASSRSIGLYVLIDLPKYLPEILKDYDENPPLRNYLLTSIKQVLNSGLTDREVENLIWNRVWENISQVEDLDNLQELRNSADVLAKIILLDKQGIHRIEMDPTASNAIIYTKIVVLKQLINYCSLDEDNILQHLIIESMPVLDIKSVEIRQVHIGTLLTALHNIPQTILPILNDVILPKIYIQLKSNPEFKKVIPMGPYKYVIDEGLEIRKLCYELLYTIISLDQAVIHQYNINLGTVGEQIIERGLLDEESDIVILSCINLVSLLTTSDGGVPIASTFETFLIDRPNLLLTLISNLRADFSKKLKPKASAQESESREETLRAIVKLVRCINLYLTTNSYVVNEWTSFYVEVKSAYIAYFNALESEVSR